MENRTPAPKTIACVFTGHRPNRLPDGGSEMGPGMTRLKFRLLHTVEDAMERGVDTFYAGGAPGFDTIAAEAVLALKPYYPNVQLRLALPSRTQSTWYAPALKVRYERILDAADDVFYASRADNSAASMFARNRYMVEHADTCICYLAANSGGTYMTVSLARKKGIPILNLYERAAD